jgi:hypothetical protein
VQIDPDMHPSAFDAVVAIDAGVDHLLQYRAVTPDQVQELVHGSIFTRGPQDLKSTAIFVGGADVAAAEELLKRVLKSFFGPLRVSVMMDANGANTTAAAAVIAAGRHVKLKNATALVLAATGPVGQRVVRLLAREGARVRVGSRDRSRAERICENVRERVGAAVLEPLATNGDSLAAALEGVSIVISAGAAGIELLPAGLWQKCPTLEIAIDLNAVPPVGIGGVEATDRAASRNGVTCYGAIGVGGTKMKIHSTAIARLFQSNSQVFDAEEIYAIGRELEGAEATSRRVQE